MDADRIKEFLRRPFARVKLVAGRYSGLHGALAGLFELNPPEFAIRVDGSTQLIVVGCDDFEAESGPEGGVVTLANDPVEVTFAPRLSDLLAALPPGYKVTLERSP